MRISNFEKMHIHGMRYFFEKISIQSTYVTHLVRHLRM